MKNGITILFLSVYLFSSTELNQLLKLPILYEHYQEHHLEDNSLSMLDFISMHYSNNDTDKTDQEDMKLPFKSPDGCFSASMFAFITQPLEFTEKFIFFEKEPLNNYSYKEFSSSYLSSIWQPPRLALS
ncbi:MAG: hypothetical protein PHQ74_13515 [Crocinitomicaceae bacterium]|nr:hypothetical protein [Crocinitomicaceae bacterium]